MEVKIRPISGCMTVLLAVVTLGVAPLMVWLNQRTWPQSVDDQGLLTRSGTCIPWNEFTSATRVITTIGRGGAKVEHYELHHAKGKVIVADYRLENGAQVFNYIWQRLPEKVKQTQ